MCWLVVKPANKSIPEKYIDTAQKLNEDGYGIAWYNGANTLKVFKTLDYEEFKRKLATLDKFRAVVHLRAASVGKVNVDNIHPFKIPTGVMFHNGTITTLKPKVTYNYSKWDTSKDDTTCNDESDTLSLATIISECKYRNLSDILPLVQHIITKTNNKLVFAERNGQITIMNKELGNEEDGIWYSNKYHIPAPKLPAYTNNYGYGSSYSRAKEVYTKPELVFVYGTLKKGYGNNFYMNESKFIGEATTVNRWRMIGKNAGFPYLLKMAGATDPGYHVKGEVYEVPAKDMPAIDTLEGIPYHYRKSIITVKIGEKYESVNVYVKATITPNDLLSEHIEEWTAPKRTYSRYTKPDTDFIDRCEGVMLYTEDELRTLPQADLQKVYEDYWYALYGSKPHTYQSRSYQSLLTSALYVQGRMEAELESFLDDDEFSLIDPPTESLQTIKDELHAAGYTKERIANANSDTLRLWHRTCTAI